LSNGKYAPLERHLQNAAAHGNSTVSLTFSEIDQLVNGLPPSATRYRTWWGNSSQSQSLAWRAAGWHVDSVDLDARRVTFATGRVGGSYADRGRKARRSTEDVHPPATPFRAEPSVTEVARIGLVGCVKTKGPLRSPARDLYTSALFVGRRTYVERTCDSWFVLSAAHGLVAPLSELDPYDMSLDDMTTRGRRQWALRVLEALDREFADMTGLTFEIHAGSSYRDYGLLSGLRERGAHVEVPAEGLGQGEQNGLLPSSGNYVLPSADSRRISFPRVAAF
jgi:hypothetical protein